MKNKNIVFNKKNLALGAKFWIADVIASLATLFVGGLFMLFIFLLSLTGLTILITISFVILIIVLMLFYLIMIGFLANKLWKIR
jgi:VIT1/CCC1 family predicted Fe2+/Mn2+ transporter